MSPVAPGTAGSLVAVVILGALLVIFREMGWALTAGVWNGILVAGVVGYGALCVGLGRWATEYYGRKDPGACVLDEGAGICLTALFVPIYPGWREAWPLVAAFVAVRLFDIVKFPPAKRLERLPHGWGILLDDLAAAVYANVVCQAIVR